MSEKKSTLLGTYAADHPDIAPPKPLLKLHAATDDELIAEFIKRASRNEALRRLMVEKLAILGAGKRGMVRAAWEDLYLLDAVDFFKKKEGSLKKAADALASLSSESGRVPWSENAESVIKQYRRAKKRPHKRT